MLLLAVEPRRLHELRMGGKYLICLLVLHHLVCKLSLLHLQRRFGRQFLPAELLSHFEYPLILLIFFSGLF